MRLHFKRKICRLKILLYKIGLLQTYKYDYEREDRWYNPYKQKVIQPIPEPKPKKKKIKPRRRRPSILIKYDRIRTKLALIKRSKQFQQMKKDWKEIAIFVTLYGILINYIFYIIAQCAFKWYTIWAYGFAYYFIREELPPIIRKARTR